MKIFNKKSEEEKVEEEIISMVNEGNEQGLIEDSEAQFITNIFEFTDKESRDVMTARLNVMAIDKNSDLDEVMEIMIENNYSRYPVYDGDLDNIVGIIYFKDFVKEYLRDKTKALAEIMGEATFVHPTYNIAKLVRRMQTAKIHMVIVVDEYGQTEGIVTMEDILEEIVGNILDEYDEEDEMIQKQNDGSMIANGLTELEDLEDLIPVTFDKEDYETLNGFLIDELEHIPGEDEKCVVDYDGYRFTALQVDNNIIQTVKIEKLPEA